MALFVHPIAAMVVVLGQARWELQGGASAAVRWGIAALTVVTGVASALLIGELDETCAGECVYSHDKAVWLPLAPLLTFTGLGLVAAVSGTRRFAVVYGAVVVATLALGGWAIVAVGVYALLWELGLT